MLNQILCNIQEIALNTRLRLHEFAGTIPVDRVGVLCDRGTFGDNPVIFLFA